jgi:hypothetical protein
MSVLGSGWVVLAALIVAGCASSRGLGRATELAGTPSPTGCDAWFEIGGTFARVTDVRYTLKNRSANPTCLAARVTVLFSGRLPSGAVRVSSPPGWSAADAPCQAGGGACGIEWRTREGVRPGKELTGFGLAYDSTSTPLQKVWIVDLGRRRVEMPIGTVGGIVESEPDATRR